MNQANQPGGLRCHDAEACAMGQRPCPTPKACGLELPMEKSDSVKDAHFIATHFKLQNLPYYAGLARGIGDELISRQARIASDDRILRASVPERWKGCTSPVGAAQSYIAELEAELSAVGAGGVEPLRKREPVGDGITDDTAAIQSKYAAQPSRECLQQSAEGVTYPPLPEPVADWVTRGSVSVGGGSYGHEVAREGLFTAEQMRAYADAALQAAPPAQAGEAIAEISSANHDDAQFGERGIKVLSDFQHLEYGTKLYALAAPPAPEAVAVQDERSEFETWTRGAGLSHLRRGFGKEDDYDFVETRRMWAAWQARAALAAAPAQAQGCTRSHPHENMSPMCELRTEIARLNHAAAFAPAQAVAVPWDNFPAYLIDHCEGDTITEEGLQRALAAMLADPQYAAAPAQEHATQLGGQGLDKCLCTFAQRVVGDGCRHCNPQEYIDRLHDSLDEYREEADAAAPIQAQEDARAVDADGEAFRTAANLGLTLRFYGGCAQSGMPGSVSVYEVEPGADRAEAMRAAINRAAARAAQGAAAQKGGA